MISPAACWHLSPTGGACSDCRPKPRRMILSAARPASGYGLTIITVTAPLSPTSNRGCPNVHRRGNGRHNISRVRFRTAAIISTVTGCGRFRRCRRVKVCGYSARRITRSRRTAEISPFISLSASIPTITCMSSISGARRRPRINGSRPSRDLSSDGSQWVGGRDRSDPCRDWPMARSALPGAEGFVARQTFPTRGDKSVRAQSIRGRAALNGLYIPANAPWRATFEAELLSFPAGKYDDIVDALGLVGQLLDHDAARASQHHHHRSLILDARLRQTIRRRRIKLERRLAFKIAWGVQHRPTTVGRC